MGEFVHLHLHSEYSLLDGACRISDLPERVKECGQDACAITDHGNMYGVIEFYLACKKSGVKPIIGCEVYVAPGSRFERSPGSEKSPYHLVLLCKNQTGYKNLIYMVSKAFTEGFYGKPRVDTDLLREHSEGLVALSACLAGRIPRELMKGEYEGALKAVREYCGIFGKDNFYIELQDHGIAEQKQILPELIRLSEETGVGLVATNDCHYLRKKDAQTQAILMCIQTGNVITDGRPIGFETDEFYMKTTDEMKSMFGTYGGAIENTVKIAESCNVEFDFDTLYLPKFPTPDGIPSDKHLRAVTEIGFNRRIADGTLIIPDGKLSLYRERMEYELGVIINMGYADYFLIVQDYTGFARSKGIPVGPGRGSGAGSLVAFVLGITDIDPIKFDLLFERFLNPERVSMPDIDIDFCYVRRDEVIEYVAEKYGNDHVSQIITFGTLAARAAIRDTGRAMGMPYNEVDAVAKTIPQMLDMTIAKALKMPELKTMVDSSLRARELVETASALEGMPRNVSVHAAGIVITDKPVSDYVPLSVSGDTVVTQFDMNTVAKLGLLKFDFLALRYLTIISDAEKLIKEKEPDFNIEKISFEDKAAYDLLSRGSTSGIFQLESSGIRDVIVRLKPENIEDIIAVIALYRPGPMDSIPKYIEARHDPSKVKYSVPQLEPILHSTYGCVVYQEQVMMIFRELAGYTFGHADIVRKAMSKKKMDVLEAERDGFVSGASQRGIDRETADKLFDDMTAFGNYAFNKSHAAAYAVLAYRTAYLKAHYPQAYFAALLTSVLDSQGKIAEYTAEAAKFKISVLPPNINHSRAYFSVDGKNIRFGLAALKNVGKQFIETIEQVRNRQTFKSLDDFAERMSEYDLNKRQVEALIKSGSFDGLGHKRSQMLAVYEQIIDRVQQKNRDNLAGQMNMFSMGGENDAPSVSYPDIPEFSMRDILMLERESSGMFFSGHMLDGYGKCIESIKAVNIAELLPDDETDGDFTPSESKTRIAGIITNITTKATKNDETMAFIKIEDRTGEMECILFAKKYPTYSHLLRIDLAVAVDGNISVRENEMPKILVDSIVELIPDGQMKDTLKKDVAKPVAERNRDIPALPNYNSGRLFLRVPDFECREYLKVKNLVDIFDGEGTSQVNVMFYNSATKEYSRYDIHPILDEKIIGELSEIIGKENVVLK